MNNSVNYDISNENLVNEVQDKVNYILNIWSEIKNFDLDYLSVVWPDEVGRTLVNKYLENDIYVQRINNCFEQLQVVWRKYLAAIEAQQYLNNNKEE